MNKRVKHFVAIVIAAAGVLSTSSIAKAEDVTGGGASFPVSFLTPAIAEFNKTFGHNLTYTSTGSGTGNRRAHLKSNFLPENQGSGFATIDHR